jgi:hypothetical protein
MIDEGSDELVGRGVGVLIGGELDVEVVVVGGDEGSAVIEGGLQLVLVLLHCYHNHKISINIFLQHTSQPRSHKTRKGFGKCCGQLIIPLMLEWLSPGSCISSGLADAPTGRLWLVSRVLLGIVPEAVTY